ncbi:probable leucine-rich repeat receptor-like protein kinase At2g33170 [Lycium barbarum]|uniref:probable leucine-rich repeat receptor-like protein kinase At2g33170 n=1 Tax=Lycium barbarum TaxID=112863 RepID=UPI00293E9515|nr:probable leucine-rich repeat receptor-like protein kinase At2g33170 [Lycium barbarum]
MQTTMITKYVYLSSILYLPFLFHLVFSQLPTNQINTMRSVYDMLQNNTGTSFVWNGNDKISTPCSWRGISCNSDNSSITKVSFPLFSISSSEFLPFICQISTLESLDVSQNHLSSITNEFITSCGRISGLKLLNLSRNKLEGILPSFTGFGKLESLDFSHNNLNGKVELQLSGLNSLKSLNLSYNQFIGSVPTSLGKFNLLEELQLSANSFQGEFPTQILKFGNLTLIDLTLNYLSGVIPDRLGELSKLQVLIVSSNILNGTIPQSLMNIKTLTRFAANLNGFVGSIPIGLTKNLRNLDLSFNDLNGTIPQDLLSPRNLQFVDLTSNNLEGPVPSNMSVNLIRLRLGQNDLNGSFPSASFGSLQSLTYLELDNNHLSGPIPSKLGKCQKLALLNLARNKLSGPIPVELADISNLQVLSLQINNLVGEIPSNISQLNRLQRLNISWNSLTGSIPSSLSSLISLTNLNLQGNKLSGQIPFDISNLYHLLELQLGGNQLGGPIPEMPLSLAIALNLSHNLFQGPIPISLSSLTSLEVLDLSYNRLSGQIPNFLTKMGGLTILVLSNNQLSGVVPSFGGFVNVDTSGNRDLIYPSPVAKLEYNKKKAKTLSSTIVLLLFVLGGFAFGISAKICIQYVVLNSLHIQYVCWITDDSLHRSQIKFSKAMASISRPINIIQSNEFYAYYKVMMPCGLYYCIKKITRKSKSYNLHSFGSLKQGLVSIGHLGNYTMAPLAYVEESDTACIIYEYPQHGTLFDLLHGRCSDSVLDWKTRFAIAVGICRGLAILHGGSLFSDPIILLHVSTSSIFMKHLDQPLIGDIELERAFNSSQFAVAVGYVPPEYAYVMRVTEAGNMYSFGVIMLELLTGKPAISEGTELAKWIIQHENIGEVLDSRVSGNSVQVHQQMLLVLELALQCLSISPSERPDAKELLETLLLLGQQFGI